MKRRNFIKLFSTIFIANFLLKFSYNNSDVRIINNWLINSNDI